MGRSILFDSLLTDVFTEGNGSLAAASPAEWLMVGFLILITVLLSATVCSLVGYAIKGHLPEFCKTLWLILAKIMLVPIVALALLGFTFTLAYVVCMRFVSNQFDDIGWGWTLLLALMSFLCMLAFSGLATLLMDLNKEDMKEYKSETRGLAFRKIEDEKKGGNP